MVRTGDRMTIDCHHYIVGFTPHLGRWSIASNLSDQDTFSFGKTQVSLKSFVENCHTTPSRYVTFCFFGEANLVRNIGSPHNLWNANCQLLLLTTM